MRIPLFAERSPLHNIHFEYQLKLDEQVMKTTKNISKKTSQSRSATRNSQPNSPLHGGGRLTLGAVGFAAGMCLLTAGPARAADAPTVAELQAQVARLQQEVQILRGQGKETPPAVATTHSAASPQATGDSNNAKDAPPALDAVVVQARSRTELLADVPIPVSAISGKTLQDNNAVAFQDFAKLAPNLAAHVPNARQTSISIRGVGKNTANDALEPSVGVIIDGVPSAFIAQSWGNFADLDHIEVLRGPQGTLLGKNTTLGVVNIVTKAPSFKPESSFELGLGDHNAVSLKGSIGGAIQDGVLAYRASVFSEKRDGPFKNIAPDQSNETFGERNRSGARVQFLLLPSPDLSIRVIADRQQSAELIAFTDPPLFGDPAVFPNGTSRTAGTGLTYTSRLARSWFGNYQPLVTDWNTVDNSGSRPTQSTSNGLSAEVNWNIDDATLTSITSYRDSLFDAKNANWSQFNITHFGALINQKQVSQELRLNSSLGKAIDYTAGIYLLNSQVDATDRNLFGSDAGAFYATAANYNTLNTSSVGRLLLQDSLKGLFTNLPAHPDTKSVAEFGQLNWHIDDKATLTLGLRRTQEDKSNSYNKTIVTDSALTDKLAATTFDAAGNAIGGAYIGASAAQIAAAKTVRLTQLSSVGPIAGQPINATSYAWLINPSYKLNADTLLYTSLGYGEKSGSVQFNTSSMTPSNVDPEKALDFELGLKTNLLDRRLALNLNLYQTQIKDYQQNLTVVDATTTTGFRTYLGNIKGLTLRGIEVDGSYILNKNLNLNFSGAYNDAFYSDFSNAPCASDISGQPGGQQQCDYTGKQIPFAPKLTTSVGFDYRHPISSQYRLHAFGNVAYRGGANYNSGLSELGWQDAYSIVDGGLGIQTQDGKWELALVGKNLADKQYVTSIGTYSNQAAITATPGDRRYLGVVLRARQF